MPRLNSEVRQSIENFIDQILKNPTDYEETISSQLLAQGIEPDIERIICAISGYLYGRVRAHYWFQFKQKNLTTEELRAFHELMRRRTSELREAMTLARSK